MEYGLEHYKKLAIVCGVIDLGIQENNENHIMLMFELVDTPQQNGYQLQEHQKHQNEIICLQMKNEGEINHANKNILAKGLSLDSSYALQLTKLEMLVGRACYIKIEDTKESLQAYSLFDANKTKFAVTLHTTQNDSKKEIADSFIFNMENPDTWNTYYNLPIHIQFMIESGAKQLLKREPSFKGIVPEITRKNEIRKSSKISIYHISACVIIGAFIILFIIQFNISITVAILLFIVLAIFNQRESNRQRYAGVKWK